MYIPVKIYVFWEWNSPTPPEKKLQAHIPYFF